MFYQKFEVLHSFLGEKDAFSLASSYDIFNHVPLLIIQNYLDVSNSRKNIPLQARLETLMTIVGSNSISDHGHYFLVVSFDV